jgi:hypothetical protein
MIEKKASSSGLIIWALPYTIVCALGMGVLSWLLENYLGLGISLFGHVVAIALASLMVFLTLFFFRKSVM